MSQLLYNTATTTSPAELQAVDRASLTPVELVSTFVPGQDYIDATLFDETGQAISTNRIDTNLTSLQLTAGQATNTIFIDPTALVNPDTLIASSVLYSFFRPVLSGYLLAEVSSDRTEIRLKPLSKEAGIQDIINLRAAVLESPYYTKTGIKLGQGDYIPVINVDEFNGSAILKLYEALPTSILLNQSIEIIQEIANPISYTFTVLEDPVIEEVPFLRGPNFGVDTEDQATLSTDYLNYNNLYSYPVTGSFNKIFSEVKTLSANINVDYTDFANFIHFSSAKERLANFRYKVQLLETYEVEKQQIQSLNSASLAISSSNVHYDTLIKGIVEKFDGYEKYLYYESSSKTWPKSNNTQPYTNVSSSDALAIAWYASEYTSASLYDELNESGLEYTTPEYIRQNPANAPYSLFVNMIGQHFDDLWLYTKDYTNKYNADNRLDYGISKDLVAKTLQNFGVKLYSSNFAVANLTSLLLGEWYDSGSEQISSFVTASNQPTPDGDILTETYKRIYHNLPYLIKTKGTERGLRALINTFGIPSGSLTIDIFGGVSRSTNPYFAYDYPAGDKIRLDDTGSLVPGNTLSRYTSTVKPISKYNQDLHIVEVGFSPTNYINDYIISQFPGNYMTPLNYVSPFTGLSAYVQNGDFNIDEYIGHPGYLYQNNYKQVAGTNLYAQAETLLSSSSAYDVFDFVRLIKFFDNQLFKMVKDFVPARDVTTSGIIIKPHVLNRSKVKSAEASWTQPEYSASIDTAFTSGSNGGVLAEYSTAYSQSLTTPAGPVVKIHNVEEERINGELGGTIVTVYTGSLNLANPFKNIQQPDLTFNITNTTSISTMLTGSFVAGDIFIYAEVEYLYFDSPITLA